MKRILVPTDFSVQAENALKVAAQLAKKNDSEIYILNSIEMPMHIASSESKGGMPESLFFIKLAKKRFEEVLKKPYLKGLLIHEAIIGHSEVFNDIIEATNAKNIDLIVMGSHGTSGFMEMFIGSNTEKVVRTSKIPVLVIKNEHVDFSTNNFVFATDFSKDCKNSFKQAVKFADNAEAKLSLLYVNTPNAFKTTKEITKKATKFTKELGKNSFPITIYNDTSVEKGILNFAKDTKANLIGLSTHGRKGLSHFFNGSISEDLVNHANMPVITFRI